MYNRFIIVVFDSQSYLRSIEKYFSIFDSMVYRINTNVYIYTRSLYAGVDP